MFLYGSVRSALFNPRTNWTVTAHFSASLRTVLHNICGHCRFRFTSVLLPFYFRKKALENILTLWYILLWSNEYIWNIQISKSIVLLPKFGIFTLGKSRIEDKWQGIKVVTKHNDCDTFYGQHVWLCIIIMGGRILSSLYGRSDYSFELHISMMLHFLVIINFKNVLGYQ